MLRLLSSAHSERAISRSMPPWEGAKTIEGPEAMIDWLNRGSNRLWKGAGPCLKQVHL